MAFDPVLIIIGLVVGLSLGLTGGGGAILAIPLLVYGVALPLEHAFLISLVLVACISVVGGIRHAWAGNVDVRAALLFSVSGILISPFVAHEVHRVNATARLILFAAVMFIVGYRMAFSDRHGSHHRVKHPKLWQIFLGGAVSGAVAGFFGISGGFVIVPLLTTIFGLPYKKAVGTSLVVIIFITTSAILGASSNGPPLDWIILFNLIGGGLAGLLFGASFVDKVPERIAKQVFALAITSIAIFMLFDKLRVSLGDIQ